MSNHDFRHRAEMGQLWYDSLRQSMTLNFVDADVRRVAIFDLATRSAGDVRDIKEKLADAMGFPNEREIERLNRTLPVGISRDLSISDALSDAVAEGRKLDVPADILGEYVRYAHCVQVSDIVVNSHPSELLVSDHKLIESILKSSRGQHDPMDLSKAPFSRCWWEFSKPVHVGGVDVRACVFASNPSLEIAVGGLIAKAGNPYKAYVWGFCHGISTGCCDLPFRIDREKEYAEALGRLWDFVTCRNISYEVVRRRSGRLKVLDGRYSHQQGKNSIAIRQVVILGVNRVVKISDPDDEHKPGPQHEWAFRSLVPGAFHRWVYCQKCGDVHRHDLIGCPCRKCGEVVGPRANLRIEKYWHEPYYRGPVDATIKETVRVITK